MSSHLMFNNFHISAGLSQKLSDQQNTKVVPLLLIYLRITFLFSQLTSLVDLMSEQHRKIFEMNEFV